MDRTSREPLPLGGVAGSPGASGGLTVLIVAFEFPPLAAGGTRRPVLFANHLTKVGFRAVVLTSDAASYGRLVADPIDAPGLARVLPAVEVVRISAHASARRSRSRAVDWLRAFRLRDDALDPWLRAVREHAPEIIARHRPDVALVTVPPFELGAPLLELLREAGIPTVVDFRDSWSQWGAGYFRTRLHYLFAVSQERRMLRSATRSVCATDGVRRDLRRVHGPKMTTPLETVMTGVEHPTARLRPRASSTESGTYTIGHFGTTYFDQAAAALPEEWWRRAPHRWSYYRARVERWEYRTPRFFLEAVRTMLDSEPDLADRLRIVFAGHGAEDRMRREVARLRLGHVVELFGRLDSDEMIAMRERCDAFLITSAEVPDGGDYCLPRKLFDYFEDAVPVLGFVKPGETERFLREAGGAIVFDPDDRTGAAELLTSLVRREHGVPDRNQQFLESASARRAAEQVAAALRGAVSTIHAATSGGGTTRSSPWRRFAKRLRRPEHREEPGT